MAYKTQISCVCIPSVGFTCKACAARGARGNDDLLEGLRAESVNCQESDRKLTEPDLTGYGYHRADQDGYDGGYVTPAEHKEEEFFRASEMLLDAKEI